LPRLYAIVDAGVLARHEMVVSRYAEHLRDAGVRLVQYRDKSGDQTQILRNAKIIEDVFAGTNTRLVMNDDPVLAMLSDWNAVHLGQTDVGVAAAREVLLPGGIVGRSTHNEAQVRAAEAEGADYIAIGPVFATQTKENPDPVVGLEGVRKARALTSKPLVAIGGITRGTARRWIEAGADSVAVIGALIDQAEGIEKVARDFLNILR